MTSLKDIQALVQSGEINLNQINLQDKELAEYAKSAGLLSYGQIKKQQDQKRIWQFFHDREDPYYHRKALSYSFLKHIDRIASGQPPKNSQNFKPFLIGRAFEDMFTDCFDPQKYLDLDIEDLNLCNRMVNTAYQCPQIKQVYVDNKPDLQTEHNKVIDGLKWKCKTDSQLGCHGYDLKTTSAKTEKEFRKACKDFGYWGQGYIYQEIAELCSFTFFGVSKKVDDCFVIEMTDEEFDLGYKEIKRLLSLLDHFEIRNEFIFEI